MKCKSIGIATGIIAFGVVQWVSATASEQNPSAACIAKRFGRYIQAGIRACGFNIGRRRSWVCWNGFTRR
jgi:hypothetical protein